MAAGNAVNGQPCFFWQVQPGYTPDFRLFAIRPMKSYSGKPGRTEVICRHGFMVVWCNKWEFGAGGFDKIPHNPILYMVEKNSKLRNVRLRVDDIIYIETSKHKNVFYTQGQTFSIYRKMDELEDDLKGMGLCGYTRASSST